MNNGKVILYKEASLQKIRNYFLDILAILAFIYCSFYISENPVVVVLVILFLIYSLIMSGYNRVLLFNDSVQFEFKHVVDKLSTRWLFQIKDIKSIDANLQLTKKDFIISEMLVSSMPGNSIWNTIIIEFNDGSKKEINTKIYKQDMQEILIAVRRLSGSKITISGV